MTIILNNKTNKWLKFVHNFGTIVLHGLHVINTLFTLIDDVKNLLCLIMYLLTTFLCQA